MSIKEHRPLILRSNRFLGSALVERALLTNENLEVANEKLLEIIQSGNLRKANLLNILLYELNVLDESKLIDTLIEEFHLGLIDLANYDLSALKEMGLDFDLCWATFTVPFDKVENYVKIATSYYLSKPARTYWEEQFEGAQIIWYISSLGSVVNTLERATAEMVKEEAAKEAKT